MTGAPTGWIKLILKRYSFSVSLKRLCRKKGFRLEKKGFFWWLGKNKSGKHSFIVTCGEKRFCVKLIGVRNPAILFGFVNEYTYEIKDYTFALPNTMDGMNYVLKNKEPYRFTEGAESCIVMVPHSTKVTVRKRTEQKNRMEIGSNEITPEGKFFFGKNFLKMLSQL